ncbi:hypothetical protein NTH60_000918 [Enterobacter ludwigii]|nr:hypothetical protein [Enterobacter ludwigii]
MDVTEEALLRSGFTSAELQKIKNNIDNYGGTLEEVIRDLAKRFKRIFLMIIFLFAIFIYVLLFESMNEIISYGLSFAIVSVLIAFLQPPVISFKCWRFCRGK